MEQELKDLVVCKREESPKGWKKWLTSKANASILAALEAEYPIPKTLSEKIVWMRDNLTEYPKCATCGKDVTSFDKEYLAYCSCKCAQNDAKIRNLQKRTSIEKYGVDNPAKSKAVQDKMKATCMERYGAENAFAAECKKEKMKQTWLAKYGVDNPQKCKEIRDKTKKTLASRYGVTHSMQVGLIKKDGVFVKTSKGENELFAYVKSIEPSAKQSDHHWIFPMFLDISIEKLGLAFEYDGDYWHSLPDMVERDKKKDQACKEASIKLIRVKEKDWISDRLKVCETIEKEIEIARSRKRI